MDQLYTISNQYFKDFYSYKRFIRPLFFNLVLTCIAFFFFFWCMFSYLGVPYYWESAYTVTERYCLLIYTEVVAILSWLRLQKLKDDLTINSVSRMLCLKGSYNLNTVKRQWLIRTFHASETSFYELAQRFNNLLESKSKYKSEVKLNWNDIPNIFYHQDAKPRILALFLAFCSILGALSIKESSGISEVYARYYTIGWLDILYSLLIYSAAAILLLTGLKFAFHFLIILFSLVLALIEGKNAKNEDIAKYLIRDLYKYSKVEVGRVNPNLNCPSRVNKS